MAFEIEDAPQTFTGKAQFKGMNQNFMDNFQQMAQEYYTQTGKPLSVNDAFRTTATQAEAYRKKPTLAAPPGHSWHERGLAMDIDEAQANELATMKDPVTGQPLMEKYGFGRPMMTKAPGKKYEPWHIQWMAQDPEKLAKRATSTAATITEGRFVIEDDTPTAALSGQFKIEEQPQRQPSAMGGFREGAQPTALPPQPSARDQIIQQAINPPNMGYRPEIVRPVLETTGLAGGAALGSAAGPVGTVAGAGLGYGTMRKVADALESYMGQKPPPQLVESIIQSLQDVPSGAAMEMGGQIGSKVLQKGLAGAGQVAKAALGKLGGAGTGSVEEALKGSVNFTRAMRGQISGEEVVGAAQDALQVIKNARGAAYQAKLAEIGKIQTEIDVQPINMKLRDLMKQFRVRVTPEGDLDFSSVAIGNKGRKDIQDMIETVWTWKDNSPVGIDALKRYLSDFYSESSQARAFTASLTKEVAQTLEKQIPQYVEMTKPYAEATKLIKDLESGLMLRKQGMTGRITADQTLRRLTSSMRDNFELRRDLVNVLGEQAGQDISGLVAGHAMSQVLPRGLMGLASVTEAGLTLTKVISPKFLPILVASSPRVQGEFLKVYGKALEESTGMSIPVAKMTAYLALRRKEDERRRKEPKTYKPGDPEIYPNQDFSSSESR